MQYHKSISPINKIYSTKGSQPVRVMCDDLEEYVCKYNRSHGKSADRLFREYMGACFLKEWNLLVPDFVFVEINEEHIGDNNELNPSFFTTTCFGSKFSRNFKEVDKFLSNIEVNDRKSFPNRFDYLKIALLDVWMSNDDRNYNNFNLLIDIENSNSFVPIDHENIFNTGNLNRGLYLISESDSIICTPVTRSLFAKRELHDSIKLNQIKEDYYLCIENCRDNLNNILEQTPHDWLVNIDLEKEMMLNELFNSDWIEQVYSEFLFFIQSTLKY